MRMVTICTKLRLEPSVRAIAEAHEPVFYAAGTHPMSAARRTVGHASINWSRCRRIRNLSASAKPGWITTTPPTARTFSSQSLRIHIAAARDTGLPLIIHARDADDDMARILAEEYRNGAYTCVMHCFSSGAELARAALDLGFYLSMSGIAAFPKSQDLRDIFAAAPVDRILVETDAPYLAPPPIAANATNPPIRPTPPARGPRFSGWTTPNLPPRPKRNFDRLFSKAARYKADA